MGTMKSDIRVGLVSLTANSDKTKNLQKAFASINHLVEQGADWICLPEMFSFHGPYEKLWDNAEVEDGPLNERLSKCARDNQIILFAGSVAERPPNAKSGKVYNTQYIFGRDGSLLAKYRKTHLFNLLNANGDPLYCESDGYLAGDRLISFVIDGWRVGLATCYDLRFPEFFRSLSRGAPLDCIVIPSAFTQNTGMYHWSTLLRARAIENLCFVLAPNQVGTHSPGKASFGHAMAIDPWGTVIADSGNKEATILTRIEKIQLESYRGQLPALKNRRDDLY